MPPETLVPGTWYEITTRDLLLPEAPELGRDAPEVIKGASKIREFVGQWQDPYDISKEQFIEVKRHNGKCHLIAHSAIEEIRGASAPL